MRNAAVFAASTVIAAAFAFFAPALAQEHSASPEEVLLGSALQSTMSASQSAHPKLSSNIAIVGQAGVGNTAAISQTGNSSIFRRNLSAAAQLGDANSFESLQDGSFNAAAVIQQGDLNSIQSEQHGSFNVFAGAQLGDQLGFVIRQYGGSVVGVVQTNP